MPPKNSAFFKKNPIGANVVWIVNDPVIICLCIADSFWSHSTLQYNDVIFPVKLKCLSILDCCFNFRSTIYTFTNYLSSLFADMIFADLGRTLNQTIFYNIRENLMHFWSSDSVKGIIPLIWISIHCKP